jgi:hypothetical protein
VHRVWLPNNSGNLSQNMRTWCNMHHVFMRLVRVLLIAVLCVVPVVSLAQTAPDVVVNTNVGVQAKVEEAFAHAPEMIAIAKCESGFRQFKADGTVLYGGAGAKYVGIFQIGYDLHSATALKLGHDILTVEGNIGYAVYLYSKQGTAPWKDCLPSVVVPTVASAPATTSSIAMTYTGTGTISKFLRSGVRDSQVVTLQKLLNANGFTIATSGPGSVGSETDFFGALTREAVKKFQCAKGIVCEGSEATTGYGRVGPRTRDALNALVR